MARSRSALAALLLLIWAVWALVPPGASSSQATDGVLYHPVTTGARWVYRWTGEGRPAAHEVRVVTTVEKDDEAWFITVARKEEQVDLTEQTLRVSRGGLTRVAIGGDKLTEPLPLFTLPPRPGERWESGANTTSVRGVERVRVPAGSFDAVRVERYMPLSGTDIYFTDWYAPGTGVVKMVVRVGVEGQRAERVGVLTSFTTGNNTTP